MSQFNITELDFDQIKNNLITYFKRSDSKFKDYDFTGSGLNNLLDILAYNTHYNAMQAHLAINESFLDSAQVRSNVVSRAKLLGYTPKSKTASTAVINVLFSSSSTLQIAKGSTFNASVDGVTYQFQTLDDVSTTAVTSDVQIASNLTIKQGVSENVEYGLSNIYDQKFVIPNKDVDTSELTVRVFDSINDSSAASSTVYTLFKDYGTIDGTSTIYFIHENAEGYYEISFGNNVFGKQPPAAGYVRIEYLSTKGPDANGAGRGTGTFSVGSLLPASQGVTPSSIVTVTPANGGNAAESIDSIKYNAPLSFVAQDRAVTTDDYRTLIKNNISGIDTVSVWGGETEDPPQYGRVYVSCKPTDTEFLTDNQKDDIRDLLNGKKIPTMVLEIVDPEYTYIKLNVSFSYKPAQVSTPGVLSNIIRSAIVNWNSANLNNFGGKFRYSKLITAIDSSAKGVLNSSAVVETYKKVTISTLSTQVYELNYGFRIAGNIDQPMSMISSSSFIQGGKTLLIADKYIEGDRTKRRIYTYTTNAQGQQSVVNANAGYIIPRSGKIFLNKISADNATVVNILVNPASADIQALNRRLLTIDTSDIQITPYIDGGNEQISATNERTQSSVVMTGQTSYNTASSSSGSGGGGTSSGGGGGY
tara:strand:- start:1102 stop:3036 length:1935 start_codon:yes stop_codon:yes gene_type:complete